LINSLSNISGKILQQIAHLSRRIDPVTATTRNILTHQKTEAISKLTKKGIP